MLPGVAQFLAVGSCHLGAHLGAGVVRGGDHDDEREDRRRDQHRARDRAPQRRAPAVRAARLGLESLAQRRQPPHLRPHTYTLSMIYIQSMELYLPCRPVAPGNLQGTLVRAPDEGLAQPAHMHGARAM